MSAVALLAVVLLALGGYSVLLLAVFAPKAYRNGVIEGRRQIVDRAVARRALRAVEVDQ